MLEEFKIVYGKGSMYADKVWKVGEADPENGKIIKKMFMTRGLIQEVSFQFTDGSRKVKNLKMINTYEYRGEI